MNGDGRAKGTKMAGDTRHDASHVPGKFFFFVLNIFFIQYSGWTDPTNGQGHEMQHISCPWYAFYISFKYAN